MKSKKELLKNTGKFVAKNILVPAITKYGTMIIKNKLQDMFMIKLNEDTRYSKGRYKKNIKDDLLLLQIPLSDIENIENKISFIEEKKEEFVLIKSMKIFIYFKLNDLKNEDNFIISVYFIGNKNKLNKISQIIQNKDDRILITNSKESLHSIKINNILNKDSDIFVSKYKKFINENIKSHINLINENNTSIYKGLSFLLHGKPGTGKSSIINSIILNFKNYISSVHTYTYNDIKSFKQEITNPIIKQKLDFKKISVVLIDEIDLELIDKDNKIDPEKLKRFLIFLDNIPKKLVLIMTTNNLDKVPEPLKRKGRCDFILEFQDFNKEEIEEYLLKQNLCISDIENSIVDENGNKVTIGNTINPAYLKSLCNQYHKNRILKK